MQRGPASIGIEGSKSERNSMLHYSQIKSYCIWMELRNLLWFTFRFTTTTTAVKVSAPDSKNVLYVP